MIDSARAGLLKPARRAVFADAVRETDALWASQRHGIAIGTDRKQV
jgi:hypothetical protein